MERSNTRAMTPSNHASPLEHPRWMSVVLALAAAYNLAWGAFVVIFPGALFAWIGAPQPNYPQLWQCIGMIVGVYGVGYAIAAQDPLRHWPIVLVGLLGKILGPIGFVDAVLIKQAFPPQFGITILTNDLIWWAPFALILRAAWRRKLAQEESTAERAAQQLGDPLSARTNTGASIAELSDDRPVLVVFLRHAGCTFCREALTDLARARPSFHERGVQLVLVHMGPEDESARQFFDSFGVSDVPRISDPGRGLYRALGLRRGSLGQLFGPGVWARGFRAGIIDRHLVGKLVGDGFQMPGVFLVQRRRVVSSFVHRTAADRPEYEAIAACATGSGVARSGSIEAITSSAGRS